jgi:hypothetical protein
VWHDSARLWSYALSIAPSPPSLTTTSASNSFARGSWTRRWSTFGKHCTRIPNTPWPTATSAPRCSCKVSQATIPYLERALRIKPGLVEAHNDWSLALISLGEPALAIEHFRQALRVDPDYVLAHNNWGVALLQQGKQGKAIEQFQRARGLP